MKRLLSRILLLMITLSLLLTVSGCAQKQKQNAPDVDRYLEEARRCIENGDMQAAISTLEVGIRMTDDPVLKAYLEGLTTQNASNPVPVETADVRNTETADNIQTDPEMPAETYPPEPIPAVTIPQPTSYDNKYSRYAGSWGNGLLEISIEGQRLDIFLSTEENPWGRVAIIEETIYENNIANNKIKFNFMDSWGNCGYCDMMFEKDCIVVTIDNITYESSAMYNFAEGTTKYYRYSYESQNSIISNQPQPEETFDSYDQYNGSWSNEHCYLRVEKIQEGFFIYLEVGTSFAGEFIAPTSCLNSDCISLYISDDGYGCSGTLNLQYVGEKVVCSVQNLNSGAYKGLLDYYKYIELSP